MLTTLPGWMLGLINAAWFIIGSMIYYEIFVRPHEKGN